MWEWIVASLASACLALSRWFVKRLGDAPKTGFAQAVVEESKRAEFLEARNKLYQRQLFELTQRVSELDGARIKTQRRADELQTTIDEQSRFIDGLMVSCTNKEDEDDEPFQNASLRQRHSVPSSTS